MNYEEFKKQYSGRKEDIARKVYLANQDSMRVKKEKTAVANLDKILSAVFSISYKKGFQAMSMRDLSRKTGMSPSGLYGCISGKEELLAIIQDQGRAMVKESMEKFVRNSDPPLPRLRTAIRVHIFLSELFRPLFYFSFMEFRNLRPDGFRSVREMEEYTQKILADILVEGEKTGVFKPGNHELTASMIKALQQEWYLKRWKYTRLKTSVDQFAEHVLAIVENFCLADPQPDQSN